MSKCLVLRGEWEGLLHLILWGIAIFLVSSNIYMYLSWPTGVDHCQTLHYFAQEPVQSKSRMLKIMGIDCMNLHLSNESPVIFISSICRYHLCGNLKFDEFPPGVSLVCFFVWMILSPMFCFWTLLLTWKIPMFISPMNWNMDLYVDILWSACRSF